MLVTHRYLMPEIKQETPAIGPGTPREWTFEEFLPMELIRSHTKTDDIARVTDQQMNLYRQAAVEAAEKYTGLLIGKQRHMRENIKLPASYNHDSRRRFKHLTEFAIAESQVYVTGPGITGGMGVVTVEVGSDEVYLPNIFYSADFSACCAPCGNGKFTPDGGLFFITYLAGYPRLEAIPAGIILGCLKFIAWNVENPGDTYKSVNDNPNRGQSAMEGTNNAAYASGAIEQWRVYASR